MNNKNELVQKYITGTQKHIRKQQLRDARRKNGPRVQEKKPRFKKVAPYELDDWKELEELEFENYEPIISKDERERRREIEKSLNGSANGNSKGVANPQITEATPNSSPGISALVVEVSSGMCRVELDGEIILCSIRGSLKAQETGYTNVVAVGDQVLISRNGDAQGIVESIFPRRSVLSRPYSPDQGVMLADLHQIVVANVDRLLIVASWREPYLWPALIDRYLIAAQRNNIEAVICINKVDLVEDQAEFEATIQPYQALGHPLIRTSTVTGAGIEELRQLLDSETSVLAGLSGVGKSSLLTAVQPSLNLKVSGVSDHGLFTGQGRHTTTQSSLWKLKNGGVVIDTPGVRTFGLAGIAPGELAAWYPEMMPLLGKCRFNNCTHIAEPDCAIQAAAANGEISALRYKNYTQIFEELASL
ncbi:MAG TPA: ribosome small subunit-dependent GTPase A [Chloroflexi bacterium]|nr:ribosome small subunit-dependent GTPase A [Chloroflexota bacterium]